MSRYIWRDGVWRDPNSGTPMECHRTAVCMPMVQGDIAPYQSPLGSHFIDGRRAQREELKRNGMVINDNPAPKFDRDEYAERKQRQAKYTEQRKAGL